MTPPAKAVARPRSLVSLYRVFLPALIRSTPCLPVVQGESLSGLDLSGTTHRNIGIYRDSWTSTDVTGNYTEVIIKTVMNDITQATTMRIVNG